jgi:hypothetical protein
MTGNVEQPEPVGEEQPPGLGRGWRIAAVIAVLAALTSVGALGALLLRGSGEVGADVRACIIDPSTRDFTRKGAEEQGHARPSNCPPEGAARMDGLVQQTDAGGFTIRVIRDGRIGEELRLNVREPDRPYIDIAHAGTHAALGQPIRVYTLEVDGEDSVVYMEDAPLLG